MSVHVVPIDRSDMADLLNLPDDSRIERIEVAFSPMMDEWSFIVDLADVVEQPTGENQ